VLVTTASTPDGPTPGIDLGRRDLTLDLARVFCVLLVVAIHLMFVGVGPDGSGGIAVSRPLEQQPWFWVATWFGQVMPLFFVVGGFASATAIRSQRRRVPDAGEAYRTFVHGRMQRLARPAFPLFVFLAVALVVATAIGVDAELLDSVAIGVGSPLWFLCAYLICQLLAPALLDFHERAPRATFAVLLAAVVAVDVAQFSVPGVPVDGAGMSYLGYLNMLFVWPLVTVIGYWYADGWFARRTWWQLALIAAICWLSLVPMTALGPYSPNMLTNLNPPTLPLVALGIGQAAVLQLLKPPLTALMRTRAARAVVFVVGSRLMTVYLWHLPVIVAIAGVGLLIPGTPEPGSATWWLLRPLLYVVVLGVVLAISLPLGRFERALPVLRPASVVVLGVAAALTIIPTVSITVLGLDPWLASAAAIGFGLAVLLLRRGQNPKSPPKSPPKSAVPKSAEPMSDAPVSADAPASALSAPSEAVES
jgi:fucose 4-O-acetylase-like acetyltransferase